LPAPLTWIDLPVALALGSLTFIVNLIDLTRYDFGWVGDEGAFFGAALNILAGAHWNPFTLTWVYSTHPALDTVALAGGLKLFGANVVGWRMSEILLLAVSVALLYLLGTTMLGRLPALAAGLALGTNHYVMAFTRIGYNNTHVIFYVTLAMLMLVLAWRTQKPVFVFATGAAVGFCLYTFFTATLIGPIIALLLITAFVRRPTWSQVGAGVLMLLGCALVVAPALIVTTFDQLAKVAIGNTYFGTAPRWLEDSTVGFIDSVVVLWHNYQWRHHYVGGALFDPIAGVLVMVGLGTALLSINKRAERLALVWFVGGMVVVSLTNYYREAHLTRLHLVMPAAALLVGLAVSALDRLAGRSLRIPSFPRRALIAALLALLPLLNLHQLLVDSPRKVVGNSIILLLRVMQENPGAQVIEIGDETNSPANNLGALQMYPWLVTRYQYVNYAQFVPPAPGTSADSRPIYFLSMEKQGLFNFISEQLRVSYTITELSDGPRMAKAWVFKPVAFSTDQ
jgi:4-amino-4-deoxy-L-arabinose transferase-like glycosyltransferase